MSWRTSSSCLILFLIFLHKIQHIQAQCGRPVLGGNLGLTDSIKDSYPDGANVTCQCLIGYTPVDPSVSRLIVCNGTQWTAPELTCKKKSCGNPGQIINGEYDLSSGIEFGAIITAKCNEGYVLFGPVTRKCLDTGWDGRAPICDAVKCVPPPRIPNGQFSPETESYNYQESVTYSCNDPKYTLIGKRALSCSANGTFQPDPPQCLEVKCDTPNVTNGYRSGGKAPPYGNGNFVEYKCNEGYIMNGTNHVVCTENGWTPPPPRCEEVRCETPQVANATIIGVEIKTSYGYKESITYKCSEGFKLNGSATLTCEESGWNVPAPQCNRELGPPTTPPPSAGSKNDMTLIIIVAGSIAAILVLGQP